MRLFPLLGSPFSFTNTNTFITLPMSAPFPVSKNKNVVRRSFVPPAAVGLGALFLAVSRAAYRVMGGCGKANCGEYLFGRKASVITATNGHVVYASSVGPLSKRQCFAIKGYQLVTPAVVTLLFAGGPAAVFRRVVSIVIGSLQGIALRARTHVGQKLAKYGPSVTDFDTPPTVARVASSLWRHAAPPHHGPCDVFRGSTVHPNMVQQIQGQSK